jgi:hypothetical protein
MRGFALLAMLVSMIAGTPALARETNKPAVVDGPADLVVLVRSATGSDTFRSGDPVNLELVFSSATPNRYLEPCGQAATVDESNTPPCRFFNSLAFSIAPVGSASRPLQFIDHPVLGAPDRYLSSKPVSFRYLLTQTFRFQQPGDYRVQMKATVGVGDTPKGRGASNDPRAITVTREITLHIVSAP